MDERRNAKRMDLQGNIVLKSLDGTSKAVKIDILDVSQTGIGFVCDENLKLHEMYDADLKIWTGDTIHVFIEIIRRNGNEDEPSIYGGQFVGMPEADWCRIRVYENFQEYGK